MLNIHEFIHSSEEERLEQLYKSKDLIRTYSIFEDQFSETLNFAISKFQVEDNYYLKLWSRNFLNNVISGIIKKPSDILVSIKQFDKENTLVFLELLFKSDLVDKYLMISLYLSTDILLKLPYGDWIELIGRESLKYKLNSTSDLLEKNDLFSDKVNYSSLYKEYLLSWSYEENRLTLEAEKYFEKNFNKKYLQLKALMKN